MKRDIPEFATSNFTGGRRTARPHVLILGTRGIPAGHGGFETFAQRLAPYLVRQGWRVTVYCQAKGQGEIYEEKWNGVRLIQIPSGEDTAWNSIVFDWRACLHARQEQGVCLTLGYNTASFMALLKRRGLSNAINMDGIEYQRAKWGPLSKLWLRFNEKMAIWLSDHLIADHPSIAAHLRPKAGRKPMSIIPYGGDLIEGISEAPVRELGLQPGKYFTVIARPEPENSVLEIVRAFSAKHRGFVLVVLGKYSKDVPYQRQVLEAASSEVWFPGAIYDPAVVSALRFHSYAYLHGHQVGGSSPTLIEALGAGNAIISHNNRFNTWVAGAGGLFFNTVDELESTISKVCADPMLVRSLKEAGRERWEQEFTWEHILTSYETLLMTLQPEAVSVPKPRQDTSLALGALDAAPEALKLHRP